MNSATESVSRATLQNGMVPLRGFLVWVLVLAVPLWSFGGALLPLPVILPVSALTVFAPALAALIVRIRRTGTGALRTLLGQVADVRSIRTALWLVTPAVLLPWVFVAAYLLLEWTGRPLPAVIQVPWLQAPLVLLLYLVMAFGEELGWSGVATAPLLRRWSTTTAGLVLGLIWMAWHFVPFLQTGNSTSWVLGQSVYTLALRVLIVHGFVWSGGSVFAAALIHAVSNVGWSLFPNFGSHYDPWMTSVLLCLVIGVLVVFVTGEQPEGRLAAAEQVDAGEAVGDHLGRNR